MTAFGLIFLLASFIAAIEGDGGWSEWSDWTGCSATCGLTSQYRFRVCSNPAPSLGGKPCKGSSKDKKRCDLKECPVDGGWSDWSSWTPCSKTCGRGIELKQRTCTQPAPQGDGKPCDGAAEQKRKCRVRERCPNVPRDGKWSSWSDWSECSVTCGKGARQRFRSCDNPAPSIGGKPCSGSENDIEFCSDREECPVDGNWSHWGSWTPCSKTCGKGVRSRQRTCTQPAPQGDGRNCDGAPEQRETCTVQESCSRDGQWSSWTDWSECSVTCGEGRSERTRSCTNPSPLGEGKQCKGYRMEFDNCFAPIECPRDGQWSSWSDWSECSVTCGDGTRRRMRSCDNPTPLNGGRRCEGPSSQIDQCPDRRECPINGQWSRWSEWSPCTVTCGTAEIRRFRSCDNPRPMFGGSNCTGDPTEVDICDAGIKCPVNGQWTQWSNWGPCFSTNCRAGGQSVSYRKRSCNNPLPAHGGLMCQGEFLFAGSCTKNTAPVNCPIDGGWSKWSAWECTAAVAKRTRRCDSPLPTNGGKDCPDLPAIEFYRRDEDEEDYREVCGNPPDDDDEDAQLGGSGQGAG